MIQLDCFFCIHFSGQPQTGFEKNTSSTILGTVVHMMHVLFVFFAVFENLKASFYKTTCHYMPQTVLLKTPPKWFELSH